MLKFVLGILNFQLVYRTLKIIFYVFNNNFSYTQQLSFAFLLQKDSCYAHDDTDVFVFFPSSERFWYLSQTFFCLFFPSLEIFWYLLRDFCQSFSLCFFFYLYIIFIHNFYIYQKNIKVFSIVIVIFIYKNFL